MPVLLPRKTASFRPFTLGYKLTSLTKPLYKLMMTNLKSIVINNN